MCCNSELDRLMNDVVEQFIKKNNSNICNIHKITSNIQVYF